MGAVNWPEVLAGFLIGLAPLVARQGYIFIKYTRMPGRRKYLGLWWSYKSSTSGTGRIVERRMRVSYSPLIDRLSIREYDPTDKDFVSTRLTYSGHVSERKGMVRYFSLMDPASHERMEWFIFDPFFDPIDETAGLYIALDLRGIPAAGAILISRERVSLEEAGEKMKCEVLRLAPMLDRMGQ
ncbi:hypothetical protein ACLQ28_26090 [Micromonospora sp. DT201]|uniref:hypothetical protein n=1 Tax=Micromonospora sp. DT201 TaxID=3393442 RepID=UPI003CFB20F8